MTETPKGEKMDFKQPQVDHGQPQNEKRCPKAPPEAQKAAKAAAQVEQVSSAGAQSHVPLLQSPCSAPGPSSAQGAAQTLSRQRALLAAPELREGAWANEEGKREVFHPLQPCPGEDHMEQELSQGEVSGILNLPQGGNDSRNDSSKTSLHENWRRITIQTIWVNPKYPELFQDTLQEETKKETPSSDEQVPAAGAQSPAPDSPCCSPCSSRTQLAAQTLSNLQSVHRLPSSPRQALQALCILLWCSCMELQLND
ncbi:uncharacterized protein LOC111928323 [Cyanistes caeruleus]|uniref:uncharacterized protein LOC111928323 n=1 Tax=Cyanistes caeruleus TaxID=156563 RepID=UPI000CDAA3DF|nr:uncharacterized protein LOC111928323 [Cyanistes caeruleus]